MDAHPQRLDAEYVLPLRWPAGADLAELTGYLAMLSESVDVTVVDGSDGDEFDRHAAAWGRWARQVRPDPWPGRNRKVASVVTGVRSARHEAVIIADDDVRYQPWQLTAVTQRLAGADLVRPQNVFAPAPWHARWDSARSLINRAVGQDFPGTFGVRRSTFLSMGGYDGDVLFENLQLMRTVRAAGGVVRNAPDLYVHRRPPEVGWFARQRVRQAYDDFAQPGRLLAEAALLPVTVVIAVRRPRLLPLLAAAGIGLAEIGRRRHGGARVWPSTAAFWAPLWLAERAVCVWLAVGARMRGGVRYHGERVRHAARAVSATPAGEAWTIGRDRPVPPQNLRDGQSADLGRLSVQVCPDGPVLVRGDIRVMSPDGSVQQPWRAVVALCRCGHSSLGEYCDGTHRLLGGRSRRSCAMRAENPDPAGDRAAPGGTRQVG